MHPLKIFRTARSLSQKNLAGMLGVTRETVSRWEIGARKVDDELLPRVSEVTGISRTELRPDLAKLLESAEARV